MKKKNKKIDVTDFSSKEIKKNKNINEDTVRALKFLVVLLIVGCCIGILFFINGKYVSKDVFNDETTTTTTTATVNYDKSVITVDDLFGVKDDSYYVMLYDTNDDKSNFLYDNLVNTYNGKSNLYSVDLALGINKKCYNPDGKENQEPKDVNDLIITRPTLIKIENKKVTKYITSSEEIIKILKKK